MDVITHPETGLFAHALVAVGHTSCNPVVAGGEDIEILVNEHAANMTPEARRALGGDFRHRHRPAPFREAATHATGLCHQR